MEGPLTRYPSITIEYCTQCKWLLRAAYFAQELLSTFSTSIGEVSLKPSTGGTFIVEIFHHSEIVNGERASIQKHVLWDRKLESGFPETKELKRRVRDIIDPSRNLGHVDGHPKATAANSTTPAEHTEPLSTHAEQTTTLAIPKAINRLQDGEGQSSGIGERRFTPMDVDIKSRHVSSNGDLETFGESQKKGGKEGAGFCRPGDEDCG